MHIEHLIFDLDNTLYPATAKMDAGIHDRMMECVAAFFGVSLKYDENLRPFLESIKIPKIILTNSPREHAERVLARLNVRDLFDCICDIRDCQLLGKPYEEAYRIALKMCSGTVENSIFLDDMQKYTDGFASMGGTAVLVGEKNGKPLSEDSAAAFKGFAKHTGRTFKIKSIYQLKDVLAELRS